MHVFSLHFEMRVGSRVRRVVYIYIWPGSKICRSIWVITVQIMTEGLTYSSFIVITMSMNMKSWIFGLTESVDYCERTQATQICIFPSSNPFDKILKRGSV